MSERQTLQEQFEAIDAHLREIGQGIWDEFMLHPWETTLLFLCFWVMFLGLYIAAGAV